MELRLPAAVRLSALDTLAHGDTLIVVLARDDSDDDTETAPEAELEDDIEVVIDAVKEKLADAVNEGLGFEALTDAESDLDVESEASPLLLSRCVIDTETETDAH